MSENQQPHRQRVIEWSAENVEKLTKLWAQGLSAADIAKQIGGSATRCSVIGKARRLDLPPHSYSVAMENHKRAMTKRNGPPKRKASTTSRRPQAKLSIAGNGIVFEQAPPARLKVGGGRIYPQLPDAPLPKSISAAWAPLPGVQPVSRDLAGPHLCKWPITVDGDELSHCCGAVATEGPYCASHRRRSAAPVQPKKPKAPVDHHVIAIPRRRAA